MLSRRSLFSLGAASAVAPCLPALAVPSQPVPTAPSKPRRIIRDAEGRITGTESPTVVQLPARMRIPGSYITIVNTGNGKLMVYP